MNKNFNTSKQYSSKKRFFNKTYPVKFIFSTFELYTIAGIGRERIKKAKANVVTLTTTFTGDQLNKLGIKDTIAAYVKQNNIPKGFHCHISGLSNH